MEEEGGGRGSEGRTEGAVESKVREEGEVREVGEERVKRELREE